MSITTFIRTIARIVILLGAGIAGVPSGPAGADQARDWINVPIDTNFLFLYYNHIDAAQSLDGAPFVSGLEFDVHLPVLRYARSFDIAGRTSGVQFIIPYGFAEANTVGATIARSTEGIGDATAILIHNLLGAPALTAEQFATAIPQTFLTASFWITVPTGTYDSSRLLNIGSNRWAFKPQLSLGYPFGNSLIAINGSVSWYTDNDAHLGNRTLSEDPLYDLEVHYSYSFTPAFWVSLDAFYTRGGETSIDGVAQHNGENTLQLGVGASYNFTPADALAAAYRQSVAKRSVTPDSKTLIITYSHVW